MEDGRQEYRSTVIPIKLASLVPNSEAMLLYGCDSLLLGYNNFQINGYHSFSHFMLLSSFYPTNFK